MSIDNSIIKVEKNICTGCSACANVCPTQAISMVENSEGFLYPAVNAEKCVNCGKCFNICPAKHYEFGNTQPLNCLAIAGDDKLRKISSSGGVFTMLAEKVIDDGGVVCGVVFTQDYKEVYHTIVDNKQDLAAMRGAKYIESRTGDVYSKIKQYLTKGTKVLFVGCPCQVAGLYSYLGKNYEQLLTCDLLCHGVSSHKVYNIVFEKLFGWQNIDYVTFRTKDRGHDCTNGYAILKNGQKVPFNISNNMFEEAFHRSKSLRLSCYNCKYAQQQRTGDITLGDWWNFFKHYPEVDNDHLGISLVLCNNQKGIKAVKALKKECKLYMDTDFEFARQYNSFKGNHYSVDARNSFFNSLLNNNGKDSTPYDVGIVGFWNGANYGSVLTYFALNTIINEMGFRTVMLSQPVLNKSNVYQNPRTYKFVSRKFNISDYYYYSELDKLNKLCHTFVLGADQVFARGCIIGKEQFYLLDFAYDDKKKIAYASSFGHKKILFKPNEREMLRYRLSRFDYLSVREYDGIENCKTLGATAVFNLDPAFVCDKKHYDMLVQDSKLSLPDKYILAYILDPNESIRQALLYAEEKLGCTVKVILDAHTDFETNKQKLNLDDRVLEIEEIEDWFSAFAHSSFVITDSFHGTCMSIINQKNFISIANPGRGTSRTDTLKQLLHIDSKIIDNADEILSNPTLFDDVDYNSINAILEKQKMISKDWLYNALVSPQNHKVLGTTDEEQVNYKEHYNNIKKSMSFRLGRAMTLFPRKVRDVFKKK